MLCPVCHDPQLIVEYGGVELDTCLKGCGLWFDADEVGQLLQAAGVPERGLELERCLTALPTRPGKPSRRCPRCRGRMRHVRAPGRAGDVILDRCPRGHGLWFDPGEIEEILEVELGEGAEALTPIKAFLGRFRADGGGAPDQAASPVEA